MGMYSLVRSKSFKNFMSKLYGWGAAVVILGALFKIQHYPGAGLMLIIGLGTEACIFFFSGFEPPHVEPDWSLVYPELAGMYTEDPIMDYNKKISATAELDNMLEEAKIGPELIASLGLGLRNLSETTHKLSDVADASVATNVFVENIKGASKSVSELSDSYRKTAEVLESDSNVGKEYAENVRKAASKAVELSNAYDVTIQTHKEEIAAKDAFVEGIKSATESSKDLANQFQKSTESLVKSAEAIDFSSVDGSAYAEQLHRISKNLAALNSAYELQLQGTAGQVDVSNQMQETMGRFMSNLNESIENTVKYKEEAAVLARNVAALNNVYGNMLSAMNVKLD